MTNWLTKAFERRDVNRILSTSADIGHYIANAHVPLHTTENYNGQLTNQKGIHGLWQSRIPELTADEYDYFVGRANTLTNQSMPFGMLLKKVILTWTPSYLLKGMQQQKYILIRNTLLKRDEKVR